MHRNRRRPFLATLLVVSWLGSAAQAQTVAYDEAMSGDINQQTGPFVLIAGRNTVSGTVSWSYLEEFPTNDFDSFDFIVPEGMRLVSLVYDISVVPGGSGILNVVGYGLDDRWPFGSIPISGFDDRTRRADIPVPAFGRQMLLAPLRPSRYGLSQLAIGGRLSPGEAAGAAYTWTFDVEACVPASSCHQPMVLNDQVTFDPIRSTYTLSGTCSMGPGHSGEVFRFAARLMLRPEASPVEGAFVQIVTLTPPRYVAGAGQAGGTMAIPKTGAYADGILTVGESIDVPFEICLPNRDPFEFTVDVRGRPQ